MYPPAHTMVSIVRNTRAITIHTDLFPSDRKLLHVQKKGRPVSQCPHCRSLRKNRSQHVKCECHDKSHAKEDCPHLKEMQDDGEGMYILSMDYPVFLRDETSSLLCREQL